jgi:tetratricopeptide (TPR) repeat protein
LLFFVKIKSVYKLGVGLGLLFVLVAGLWSSNYIFPGRFSGLLDLRGGSLAARVNFYQAAADAIVKKPFFGYGLENSGEVFIKYYEPDWGVYGDVSATTDKAHNLVLDIILASGFVGLVFFTIFYYYFFRLVKENIAQHKMANLSLALALGAAGYLFSLLFSFTIVTGEIYFWSFLALLVVINAIGKGSSLSTIKSKLNPVAAGIIKWLMIIIILIGVSWGIIFEFRNLTADHYFDKFYYALNQEQYLTAFVLAEYTAQERANPINQAYYNRFLGDKLSDFYPDLKELSVKKISQAQLEDLNKKIPASGYENIYVKAKINSILGNYREAEKYFREIFSLTPYWPKTYIDFGRSLVRERRFSEAVISYQLAASNLPDLNDSRLNNPHREVLNLYRKIIFTELGDIYFYLKNYSEAEKNYQLAYIADVRDFTLFKKIADTYYLRGNLKKALEYNERGASRSPLDFNWFLSISTLYKEMGNKEDSLNYFNQALKLAPEEKILLDLKSSY